MKSNTQNSKIEGITEKTLVLGIDVGSDKHYARAFDNRGIEYDPADISTLTIIIAPFVFFNNYEKNYIIYKKHLPFGVESITFPPDKI